MHSCEFDYFAFPPNFFFHSLTVSSIDPNLKITFIILNTILIEVVTQALCIHLCEATLQQGSQEQG